mmetsp:Transcript_20083/g.31413  ORF Transcript_20083/g.31413 Transcript_20083/m.31413 type:complete len:205 (-) Transcript_20083:436-1050(-)
MSFLTFFMASFILTSGPVSVMLSPRSSIWVLIVSSVSEIVVSSFVNSETSRFLSSYRVVTTVSCFWTSWYSCTRSLYCELMYFSRVLILSIAVLIWAASLTRLSLVFGTFSWMLSPNSLVCSKWVLHSLLSASILILSNGATFSTSTFHCAGSVEDSIVLVSLTSCFFSGATYTSSSSSSSLAATSSAMSAFTSSSSSTGASSG